MALEHFILKNQNGEPCGLIPILEDDYELALEKAKKRAFRKVNPFQDVTVYHRVQDSSSETLIKVLHVTDKKF